MKAPFPVSITWRVRLINGLLSAGVLVTLVLFAQVRIRAVLYASVDQALRDQAAEMVRRASSVMGPPPPPFFRAARRYMRGREPLRIHFGTLSLYPPRHIPLDFGARKSDTPFPWSVAGFQAARQTGNDLRNEVGPDGARLRVYSVLAPARATGAGASVLQTAATFDEADVVLSEIEDALYALLLPLALVNGIVGALLTDIALAPVRRLTQAIATLDATKLGERLPAPGGGDTLDRLVTMLNVLLARLDAAFAIQKRFTADASHELRTPLAVIKVATSLLLETPETLTGMQRRALEGADQATDRATRLVADLLLLARTENGALPVRPVDVDLRSALVRAVNEVKAAQCDGGAQAPVSLDVPTGATAYTDPDHLHRLVVNLLTNALRHTPPTGSVTISAAWLPEDGLVELRVRDTGEGIAPDALTRLGEAFYRPDAARARTQGGAGLGLALCKGIVNALGGVFVIESVVDAGTTVTLRLPQQTTYADSEPDASHSPAFQ